jgi:hypothetical protein
MADMVVTWRRCQKTMVRDNIVNRASSVEGIAEGVTGMELTASSSRSLLLVMDHTCYAARCEALCALGRHGALLLACFSARLQCCCYMYAFCVGQAVAFSGREH